MPVQTVHLIEAHHVYHLLHLIRLEEMAGTVKLISTMLVARLILDVDNRKRIDGIMVGHIDHHIGRQHLLHRLKRIIQASGCGRLDRHAGACDLQIIALGGKIAVDRHGKQRSLAPAFGRSGPQPCGMIECFCKFCDLRGHLVRQAGITDCK